MRNYIDIIDANSRQEAEIKEIAALFEALALRQVMLNEGRLDEAGVWNAVKSAVGKGVSGLSSANDAVNRLGKLAQDTKPVQDFDNKVDEILKNIGDKNPKIAATAKAYGEWAKKNPVKQSLIIGMLTAVASLLTTPAGGAAAGAVLRAGNEMLKGEKFSTAVGSAAKGAALGFIGGLGIRELGDFIANMHIELHPVKGIRDVIEANLDYQRIESGRGGVTGHLSTLIPEDKAAEVQRWWNTAMKTARSGDLVSAQKQFNAITAYFDSVAYKRWLFDVIANNENLQAKQDQILAAAGQMKEIAKNLGAAVQGAVTGAAGSGAMGKAAGAVKGAIGKAGAAIKGAFGGNSAAAAPQPGPGTVPTAEPGVAVQQPQPGFKKTLPQQPAAAPQPGFKRDVSQLAQQPAAQAQPAATAKPQAGQKWQPAWKNKKVQGTTTTTQTMKESKKKFSYKLSIGE